MIVLDTNILSELMKTSPAKEVKDWLYRVENDLLVTTVITISEIEYGICRLPEGKRREALEERFAALTGPRFEFAVLPLDEPAARIAGRLRSARENQGLAAQSADMMIAAIVKSAGASLATRNIDDFAGTGIELINPWRLAG